MSDAVNETLRRIEEELDNALIERLVLHADNKMKRLIWQGVLGGSVPGGQTANDFVKQAIEKTIKSAQGMEGGRKWNHADEPDLYLHLKSVVDSDISHAVESWERLVRRGKTGNVRISDRITVPGPRRFAIAHELGHWELHAEYSQLFLCTEADMRDYDKSPLEVEANNFASELLMPSVLFRRLCENADPSLTLVSHLAEQFRTSLTATAIRFVNETRHRCIVVFSDNGRVKWWKRREDATRLWLEKEQAIHPHSMAWECFKALQVPDKMVSMPVEVWFKHLPFELNATVFEQSLKIGRYGVLTLLWVAY